MNLKSGLTLWAKKNRSPRRFPRLRRNIRCDVVVIGAGITGALVAHELARRKLDVVVVDRRAPGTGSTSASTALLLYETDAPLAELARRHGWDAAIRTYRLGRRAVREIGRIARDLDIDCGFEPKRSLYVASDRRGLAEIKHELRLRRRGGLPTTWLSRRRLRAQFGLAYGGALYSPGSAQIDAVRFTQELLARQCRAGKLRVFQDTEIARVESAVDEVRLSTARKISIRARYVVVATGYAVAPGLSAGLVRLHSSYVIASAPHAQRRLWKDDCLVWETARPYFYLRTTADHRIIFGGEDEPFASNRRRDARLAAKKRRLAKRFRALFPSLAFEPELAWSGTFAESYDGLPFIGARPGVPRVIYALGYGGNGITFSQVAARIVGCLCRGRRSRDALLFRFDRKAKATRQREPGPRRRNNEAEGKLHITSNPSPSS